MAHVSRAARPGARLAARVRARRIFDGPRHLTPHSSSCLGRLAVAYITRSSYSHELCVTRKKRVRTARCVRTIVKEKGAKAIERQGQKRIGLAKDCAVAGS